MFTSADAGVCKQHVINDSSAKSYVRYKYLDINNLIKCICCCNYTDITCEQYDQDTLTAWLSLRSSSDRIGYMCKYCESTNKKIKSTNEIIRTLSSQVNLIKGINERNMKTLDVYKKVISDIEKDLPALVEKVSKLDGSYRVSKQKKNVLMI